MRERIDKALECKAIKRAEAEQFHQRHAFARGEEEHREGKVCLFSCRRIMDKAYSVENLLGIWGGEAIYSHVGPEWEDRIRTLGRPAVISVDVDVTQEREGEEKHYLQSAVLAFFIGLELGLEEPGLEIHFQEDLPAAQVAAIWTPGHPEYDRHRDLPRR